MFGYVMAGLLLLVGLFRMSLFGYAFIQLARRGELRSFDVRYGLFIAVLENTAILLLGVHFMLSTVREDFGSMTLVLVAGIFVVVATLARLTLWLERVLKPMDPALIAAAHDALEALEILSAGTAGQSQGSGNGRVENARYRLREALAPYGKR